MFLTSKDTYYIITIQNVAFHLTTELSRTKKMNATTLPLSPNQCPIEHLDMCKILYCSLWKQISNIALKAVFKDILWYIINFNKKQ